MHAILLVRRSVDDKAMVRITQDGKRIETQGLKMGINPFDEIACEHTVQLKEQGVITSITAISIGDALVQDTLRHALSMGADHAIHIESHAPQPLTIAQIMATIAKKENADLVVVGAQNPDDMFGQEGVMISELLGWETASAYAQKPHCVISTDILLNTPRRVLMPQIIAARSRNIEKLSMQELGISQDEGLTVISYEYPTPRPPVRMLGSLAELGDVIEGAHA